MSKPLIQLKNVTKTYRMGEHAVHALDDVSIDIEHGTYLTIVGASGSGKSTMMHILGGLDLASGGSYLLSGQRVADINDIALSRLRNEKIGFVFQQFNLLNNLTVLENIALPLAYAGLEKEERQRRARLSAQRVGLGDRLDHTPTELSGGQAQRVAIARALVNNPDILLADEPTGALDSRTSEEILALLKELHAEGKTIIIVTHDPNVAKKGSRCIEMKDGKIIRDDHRSDPTSSDIKKSHTKDERQGLGFKDIARIGLKEGLLSHKLRTGLTMLGVIIGVASVIAMSAISLGSKKKQADQIRALGANLIRIVDQRLENQELIEARMAGSQGLSSADMHALRTQIDGIEHLARVRELKMATFYGQKSLAARILGVDVAYPKVNNLTLAQGRFLDKGDQLALSRHVIIGHAIATDIGPEALGAVLTMGSQPYTVIGILQNKQLDAGDLEASGENDANRDILLPLDTALQRTTHLPLRSELDEIHIQLNSEDHLSKVGRAIRHILSARHKGIDDFQMIIPLDLLKTKQQSQRLLDILSLCISAISLVVGGIGIMNIMLASVTERLKEIGIRRAIGATQQDIRHQFLAEAICIAAVGGLLGVLLAVIGVVLGSLPFHFPIVFNLSTMLVSVLAAFVTGLIFGYYPASKAASQNLVEVLQHD